jgi:2-polyprenyl-3-methyl-5-hydroxy-6-metoxy-1,4-benzoquinol methylase
MNPAETVILEDVDCPLRCKRADRPVLSGHDLLHDSPGEFTVVQCCSCGLMRTNPRPTAATIGAFYPDNYGPYLSTQVGHAPPAAPPRRKRLPAALRRAMDPNTERLPAMAPGRLLEIGCASGGFLHRMADQGWQVQGIEYSATAAQAARSAGYRVHTGPLETAPPPDEPFDLIVGWMVLEHLHDPVGSLRKLRAWAKPGAWLVLSVPNAKSLEFQLFKERWYALQLPTHLHHFTPETLGKVLRAGGWSVETVFHQRVLGNLVASTGYVMRDRGFPALGRKLIEFPERAGRLNQFLHPLACLLALFGQTGRMTVWARVLP